MKFHHFGIACKDINKTSRLLKKNFLAKKIIGKTYDSNQKVFLSLFKIGNTKIELVSGNSVKKFQKVIIRHSLKWNFAMVEEIKE